MREEYSWNCYSRHSEFQTEIVIICHSTSLNSVINEDSMCVALTRIGWEDQKIFSGKFSTVRDTDLGPPIHSLVIPGEMHFIETDMLKLFAVNSEEFANMPTH